MTKSFHTFEIIKQISQVCTHQHLALNWNRGIGFRCNDKTEELFWNEVFLLFAKCKHTRVIVPDKVSHSLPIDVAVTFTRNSIFSFSQFSTHGSLYLNIDFTRILYAPVCEVQNLPDSLLLIGSIGSDLSEIWSAYLTVIQ